MKPPLPAVLVLSLSVSLFRTRWLRAVVVLALAIAGSGLHPLTAAENEMTAGETAPSGLILREGDELRISFPGAPNLDTAQKIRSDGRLSLALVGEIKAAGLSPGELQQELVRAYASQLVSKEVNVVLLSRTFFVYVNGAVANKGRNDFERPVDLVEAIMAAGFDDDTANLKAVQVIRIENGQFTVHTINLQLVFDGKLREPFQLKQADMILVPRRWI